MTEHVRVFATMLTTLTGHDLPVWIEDAVAANLPGLTNFAKGLLHDLPAVLEGLTTPWNSGPVEGIVNKIKMIKHRKGILLMAMLEFVPSKVGAC